MSDATYPSSYLVGNLSIEPRFSTQIIELENGSTRRNALWNRPLLRFKLNYPYLDSDWLEELRNFWLQHRGAYDTFRFDDYTDLNPTGRVFGVGDGQTQRFKLQHDFVSNAVIYADGQEVTSVYVDSLTGTVIFATAPAEGVLLTYDADDAGYRVRFADAFPFDRLQEGAYGNLEVVLEQTLDDQEQYPIRQIVFGGVINSFELNAIGDAIAFSFLCPRDIDVTTISFYVGAATNPGTVRAKLCENDNGKPGTMLGYGDGALPSTIGWHDFYLNVTVSLEAGVRYWFTVEAQSGTWDASHKCSIQYTDQIPSVDPLGLQDSLLWGGYAINDLRCDGTPHSWLGVETKQAGGEWSAHDRSSHGAFYLNTSPPIVGHCQSPLSQEVWGNYRVRQKIVVETTHDFTIDRIGGVFSTLTAPVDDLHYAIVFGSDPGTIQRSGHLSAPIASAGEPFFVQTRLEQPLDIATGETVYITFYSPASLEGAGWTALGHGDSNYYYADHYEGNWNSVRWDEDESRAQISDDGGASYGTELMGAWTVRCRGRWKA